MKLFALLVLVLYSNKLLAQEVAFADNYGISFSVQAIIYDGLCDCSFPNDQKQCYLAKIQINRVFFRFDDDQFKSSYDVIENGQFMMISKQQIDEFAQNKGENYAFVGNTSMAGLLKFNRFVPRLELEQIEEDHRVARQTGLFYCGLMIVVLCYEFAGTSLIPIPSS